MLKFKNLLTSFTFILGLSFVAGGVAPHSAYAASAEEIDAKAILAIARLEKNIPGADKLIKKAKGVLIFPSVLKAGIGIGGEYGEGVMQINGKSVGYYSTAGVSFGFQLGAQSRIVIMLFMTKEALKDFQSQDGWKAGVDGSVAVIELDAGAEIDTESAQEPIRAFILGRKGLMYNLTLEGSKFSKINR